MNQKHEHALYISDPADLKYFYNSSFTRIYFGNEFCEFLLPSIGQIRDILAFAAREKLHITLVTPPCSESAFDVVSVLIEALPGGAEVVFNDWGLLEVITSAKKTPVHGRLLCNAKKDPRLMGSPEEPEYTRGHNIQSRYQDMLIANNIARVELDNLFQNLVITPEKHMKFSLYYPFVPCTVTRKCYFANKAVGNAKFRTITECKIHCRGKNIKLATRGVPLYMKGNAQYYINDIIRTETNFSGLDRYVYMPTFPNHNFTAKSILYLDWNKLFEKYRPEELWGNTPDWNLSKLHELTRSHYSSSPLNIIDIGCGTGRHARLFKDDNYHGIDISINAIEKARKNEKGVFIHGDILLFKDYAGFFDHAIDYGCLHTIPPYNRRRYFERVHGIMKLGGLLLLCAWTSEDTVLPIYYAQDQIPEWALSPGVLAEGSKGLFELCGYNIVPCTDMNMVYAILKRL